MRGNRTVQIPVSELPEIITEWFIDKACTHLDVEGLIEVIRYPVNYRKISPYRSTQWKLIAKEWSAPEKHIRLLDLCLVSCGPEYATAIADNVGLSDKTLALLRRQDPEVETDLCMAVYGTPF